MNDRQPIAELDAPYSGEGAEATPWARTREHLDGAGVYWLSTVRPDGRPHVTPVAAVWMDGSLYFSTGPAERKARNLEHNNHCVLTTGCNLFREGLDVVVEGDAVRIADGSTLQRLADLFAEKYEDAFGFRVEGEAFVHGEGSVAHVFEVGPVKTFAYDRREPGGATRYRF